MVLCPVFNVKNSPNLSFVTVLIKMSPKERDVVWQWMLMPIPEWEILSLAAVQRGQVSVSSDREHQDDISWEGKEARWRARGRGGRGRICGGKGPEPTGGERASRVSSQVERLLWVSHLVVTWSNFNPRVKVMFKCIEDDFLLQWRQHVGAGRQPRLSRFDRRIPAVTEIGTRGEKEGGRRSGRRRK